jgi:hypothetical protein
VPHHNNRNPDKVVLAGRARKQGTAMAQKEGNPADGLYAVLAAHYAAKPAAAPSKGFGSNALKVEGKIFASLTRGRLLLKLSEARVDSLIKSKKGLRFSTGVGRFKKEWVTVGPTTEKEWLALAEEARTFVSAQNK